MQSEEKHVRYSRIVKKAQTYSNLALDENFIKWKKDVVETRLKSIMETAMTTSPESQEHKEAVIRYQELKFVTEDIFKTFEITEQKAREALKKIENKEIS